MAAGMAPKAKEAQSYASDFKNAASAKAGEMFIGVTHNERPHLAAVNVSRETGKSRFHVKRQNAAGCLAWIQAKLS